MGKAHFESVADYIAAQPEDARNILKRVRRSIRKAVPRAEELIRYGMPAYRLEGVPLLYLAGWKAHYSLYPATEGVVTVFKDELGPYAVRKGTIRFPLSGPVPAQLIEGIAKVRAAEVAERVRAERGASKRRG